MQTVQQPSAPAAPTPPAAPGITIAKGDKSITIVGADGTSRTIITNGGAGEGPAIAGSAVATVEPRGSVFGQGMTAGVVLALVVVGVIALYKRLTSGPSKGQSRESAASQERLERMERGIEAIAIEVERISEGQRYVTNLLAESRQPAAIARESK